MKVYCQVCNELIATTDANILSVPVTGDMFRPPYPDRMKEMLFAGVDWEFMRCPMCHKRPLLTDRAILTADGIYEIPTFICEICGKDCTNRGGLGAHMRTHGDDKNG